jgi:hypothetical protein
MKRTFLACFVAMALATACVAGHAQTPSAPTDPKASAADPKDASKGQDLVGHPKPAPADPLKSPPTTGQDKTSGNNLVSESNSGQMKNTNPEFDTLDTKKHGYLLADDVKTNKWVTANFAHCDSDHDGKVSRKEYGACSK